MDAQYIRERITRLRLQKGVSEYKMSYDLGHSRGYVNNITSGKTLPSMTEFLVICDYFGITPQQFFDEGSVNPGLSDELTGLIRQLNEEDLNLTLQNVKRLLQKDLL